MFSDFFGFQGYEREAEGYLSWQHLTYVTSLMVVMILLGLWIGFHSRNKNDAEKNKVLMIAAVLLDTIELTKIVLICVFGSNPMHWLYELPLYLCSIQLITLPLAAFSKGRIKEAAIDFVCIFGVVGAVLGTYGAGQNYNAYPVLSFDNVVSGVTHSISGFAAIYILAARIASMKRSNLPVTCGILTGFCIVAYLVNLILPGSNYMFLMRHDGTPYVILHTLMNGHPVLYPLSVVALFYLCIAAFYVIFHLLARHKHIQNNDETKEVSL